MPGGRPRKPTAAKILDGTYRPDRDGSPEQVVSAAGSPEPPPELQGDALAFWRRVIPGLCERNCAAVCDASALAMMCEWWARYRRYSEALDAMIPTDKGTYQMTVLCGIATTNFDKLAARFGLTPSDRAKLRADPVKRQAVPTRKRG